MTITRRRAPFPQRSQCRPRQTGRPVTVTLPHSSNSSLKFLINSMNQLRGRQSARFPSVVSQSPPPDQSVNQSLCPFSNTTASMFSCVIFPVIILFFRENIFICLKSIVYFTLLEYCILPGKLPTAPIY